MIGYMETDVKTSITGGHYATVHIGDKIRIIRMDDSNGKDPQAREYNGRVGVIESIDDAGQLHGTWGGLAIVPDCDIVVPVGGWRVGETIIHSREAIVEILLGIDELDGIVESWLIDYYGASGVWRSICDSPGKSGKEIREGWIKEFMEDQIEFGHDFESGYILYEWEGE